MLENLREKQGEVYSPSLQSIVRKEPVNRFAYMISFGCLPKNVDHLISLIEEQMSDLIKNGPTAEEVQKFKMAYQKSKQQEVEQNGFWLGTLMEQMKDGAKIHPLKSVQEQLDTITIKSLQSSAGEYMTGKNKISFELLPENLSSK
jgi:zinc protease